MEPSSARLDIERADGATVLRFGGRLTLAEAAAVWARARAVLAGATGPAKLDVAGVVVLDGGSAALLLALKRLVEARGGKAEIAGAAGRIGAMLDLVDAPDAPATAATTRGLLERTGELAALLIAFALGALEFVGDGARALVAAARRPSSVDWGAMSRVAERAGADGVPTIALLSFLVGLIIAFHGVVQAERYGATLYVPAGVALIVARELGPLIGAVVVAGRSGSAIAAELGTMNVSEEIDAVRTMGLAPQPFLVLPRIAALAIVLPLLTVLADVCGILGGLVVWRLMLDLESAQYLGQIQTYTAPWDLEQGIVKAVPFGIAIALIACQRGLSARGGAEGVGRATTSAVVASIFAIVVIDFLATILFITWERR